jgi:chemotaxis protein methyltransferase CheR
MSLLPLSPQVFTILSAVVAERTGLHFDQAHAAVFAEKVAARAMEIGFDSLLDYYYFLRYDAAGEQELDSLVETLVVGETYLFRELGPLQTMVSSYVRPALERGRRPRVWCAASSTGEEPHTVAMLLAAQGALDDVDLVASDISHRALERARSGRFSRRALRQELPAFARPWLEIGDQEIRVRPQLTAAIDWRRVNLIDDAAVAALGTFDVVLCRNVLIYFDDRTARQVVERLAARLQVGGALFVGISESLLRFGTSLSCEEQGGVFLYRKTA